MPATGASITPCMGSEHGRPRLHRSALQRADRRPCLRPRRDPASRVRLRRRRDEPGGVHRLPDAPRSRPWPRVCRDGAIAFVCMDWRHMRELLEAGEAAFTELKNLCVWNKTNGGMGIVLPLQARAGLRLQGRHGPAHQQLRTRPDRALPHQCLGLCRRSPASGRNRADELAMHPTVKPVALVADAIRTARSAAHIVLDGFGGSGTTLIAAETCGRRARLIEYRSALLRHHHPALAGAHRQGRPSSGPQDQL